jgi:hypothetical protein
MDYLFIAVQARFAIKLSPCGWLSFTFKRLFFPFKTRSFLPPTLIFTFTLFQSGYGFPTLLDIVSGCFVFCQCTGSQSSKASFDSAQICRREQDGGLEDFPGQLHCIQVCADGAVIASKGADWSGRKYAWGHDDLRPMSLTFDDGWVLPTGRGQC